jgi:hypothetical protein
MEKHDVRYLVVGGYAVMLYSEPRLTKDVEAIRRGTRAEQSSKTEPGAAPNGGPAAWPGSSGAPERPPSVN